MDANNRDEPAFDTDFMIDNAAGLQSMAGKVDREGKAARENGDMSDFIGSFQAAPVLWALGIEIALKAWISRETSRKQPKGHDLLCLFKSLDQKTQELLEEAWKRARSTGTADDSIQELAEPKRLLESRTLKELTSLRLSSLSEVLDKHRRVFVNWRYLHENPREHPHPGVLDKVLTVLIDAYRNNVRPNPDIRL